MSFDGDLYPSAGATSVLTTKGDLVDFDTIRQRLAIGSANQLLQVKSSLPSWQTVPLADTVLTVAGDVLYEDATPALARLPKGNLNDVLTMGASLPAWSAPAAGGAWTELADVTLSVVGDTLDSGTITANSILSVFIFTTGNNTETQFRLNSDAGSNYASRRNNDGVEATFINQTMSKVNATGGGTPTEAYMHLYIINNASNEKLILSNQVSVEQTGAGTAPRRGTGWTKWTNTTDQVTSVQAINNSTGDFGTDSRIVVLGWN